MSGYWTYVVLTHHAAAESTLKKKRSKKREKLGVTGRETSADQFKPVCSVRSQLTVSDSYSAQ